MKKSFNDFACFVGLVLTAALMVIPTLFSAIGVSLNQSLISALELIKLIALVVGVAFGAMTYAKKTTLRNILFWGSIIVIILVVVFGLF